MNSIPAIEYAWCSGPWFAERLEVVNDGYYHVFTIESGRYRCLSDPQRMYCSSEVRVKKVPFPAKGLNLYIIETTDGYYKGTAIERTASIK